MNKWLSVELSVLLLVSVVAFAGFMNLQSNDDNSESVLSDDSDNELTGDWRSPWKPKPKPKPVFIPCVGQGQILSSGRYCCAGLVQERLPPVFVSPSLKGPTVSGVICARPKPSKTCAALGGKCGRPGLMGVMVLSGASDCPSSCYGGAFVPIPPMPNRTNYTQPIVNTSKPYNQTSILVGGLIPAPKNNTQPPVNTSKITNQSTNCRWVCS